MGNIFSQPDPRFIQTPRESTTVGSTSVRPYAPVEPFLQNILSPLARTFTAAPKLYEGGLTPADSPQTLAARDIYGQVGETAAGLAPTYGDLFGRDLALARGDITQDPLHLARTGAIANQARQLTERDKLLAQQQALDAGQFNLGSTAFADLQQRQEIDREDLIQQQLARSLGLAEERRVAAQGRLPALAQQQLQTQMTPGTLQEAIGRAVETKDASVLADVARLSQQRDEAERAQLMDLANVFGGLAGLGTQTELQQRTQGTGSQAFTGGPSTFSQLAGLLGTVAPFGFV
tara:strand:- start:14007 stop:14879 length:873 start_codon:yes stop_codon:yes gene_type:complete